MDRLISTVIPRKLMGFKSRIFSGFMIEEILMKTSRFSEPQILAILRQAEGGVPVPELCREHGRRRFTNGEQNMAVWMRQ